MAEMLRREWNESRDKTKSQLAFQQLAFYISFRFRTFTRDLNGFVRAVRRGGLEPPRCYPLAPQASASANSATFAWF